MVFDIIGDNLPMVICDLQEGESMVSEAGAMAWMTENISMRTEVHGGLKKAIGRSMSGDSMFQNIFTAVGDGGVIAFASSFPGSIKAFKIRPGETMVLQKSAFLASTTGISLSAHLVSNVGAGLFGGEGFIMQKVSGTGIVFTEFDGHVMEYTLNKNEKIVVSTGHVAAFSGSCIIDIKSTGGVKNALFGGEGLFHTTLTGPGKVWLQTMPIDRLGRILGPYIRNSRREKKNSAERYGNPF